MKSRGVATNEAAQLAERQLVGLMLIGLIDPADLGLRPADLLDERHQVLYRAAMSLPDKVDLTSILAELMRTNHVRPAWPNVEECVAHLQELMNATPDVPHVEAWVRQIREESTRRTLRNQFQSFTGRVANPSEDLAELATEMERLAASTRGGAETRAAAARMNTVSIDEIDREEIRWVWPNRIPAGKLTLLFGDPGLGKSHLTIDIAARVTQGDRWPDGSPGCEPGQVIIFSAEDDPADTLRPRLEAAGADLTKIHIPGRLKNRQADYVRFELPGDLPALESTLRSLGQVKLIIIDPISSYLGDTDSHKNAEVRSMLAPLAALAARYKVAVLMVTHMSKGNGGKSIYRATGSLAFVAASRMAWMLCKDLEDPERRLLLSSKCNIAREQDGLAFRIENGACGSHMIWDRDLLAMSSDDYLARSNQANKPRESLSLDRAVTWLREQLSDGPIRSVELERAADQAGIAVRTLKRARCQVTQSRRRSDGQWEVLLETGAGATD